MNIDGKNGNARFIIFAPKYNRNVGGSIALHKLCHVLNEIGYEAYLHPYFNYHLVTFNSKIRWFDVIKDFIRYRFFKYRTNQKFNTKIFKGNIQKKDVVIYPDIVTGNPLNASNVVRWFLHKPGYHTDTICLGSNELYYKYDKGLVGNFHFSESKTSNLILKVYDFPTDVYNKQNCKLFRTGEAYSVRKGNNLGLHSADAVCIDGLEHEEIAKIFKSAATFISYDPYSSYSTFASLCGCDSVVITKDIASAEDWYPNIENRYGIAFGFDDIDRARASVENLYHKLKSGEDKMKDDVSKFADEVNEYFGLQQ